MLCNVEDDFSRDYYENNPRWVVVLSNGESVFQDDGRPGVEPRSAWERLHNYCKDNNLHIQSMSIMFRSNRQALPSNMDGYYFSKGSRGAFGFPKTMQLFFVGILNNGKLEVSCWKVPEMVKEKTEERDPTQAGICLIQKDTSRSMVAQDS